MCWEMFLEEMGLSSKKDLYSLMRGSIIQHGEVLMERRCRARMALLSLLEPEWPSSLVPPNWRLILWIVG